MKEIRFQSILAGLICSFALISCTTENVKSDQVKVNTIEEIIAAPWVFDGREVNVKGWITMDHEDHTLYTSMAEHNKRNFRKCISLLNYYDDSDLLRDVNHKMVLVTGIFHQDIYHDEHGNQLIRLDTCNRFGISFVGTTNVKVIK